MTEHMILRYEQLWPNHPFVFRIPFQELKGKETERVTYLQTPKDLRDTILHLIADLDDEEWIYWCIDDKYPIRLVEKKIVDLIEDATHSSDMSGLLFCRCRGILDSPKLTLYPNERVNALGDIYYERKAWHQIWLHQLLRVKVLRHLFTRLPADIPTAKAMDKLKDDIIKPPEHRLFVTKNNFAVFGESTHKGVITQNCYDSIKGTDIQLPRWFRRTNRQHVIMGEL
ncbi:MAG: hypothetical protein QOI04_2121 [Verrucomicrobiota bacterium]|jgi:hypothetical protein